jgi:hypothetical protein
MPEVSLNGASTLGYVRGQALCQGESGSGASLGAIIVMLCLTERFGVPAMMQRSEANCCVLSKSDSACADIIPFSGQARGHAEDGFCAWWMRAIWRAVISSKRRAFGGCLGTRRR